LPRNLNTCARGKLDRHAAASGTTTEPHENDDVRLRNKELLRHGLDVLEGIQKLLDTPLDPLAAEVGAFADLGLRELHVGVRSSRSIPPPALKAAYTASSISTFSCDIA
jgi:hypothetical protein